MKQLIIETIHWNNPHPLGFVFSFSKIKLARTKTEGVITTTRNLLRNLIISFTRLPYRHIVITVPISKDHVLILWMATKLIRIFDHKVIEYSIYLCFANKEFINALFAVKLSYCCLIVFKFQDSHLHVPSNREFEKKC